MNNAAQDYSACLSLADLAQSVANGQFPAFTRHDGASRLLLSSPLRLYYQNFVSLISFQALVGACRGYGAGGCGYTGGAID